MSKLVDFLLARIAEDEAAARGVENPGHWQVDHSAYLYDDGKSVDIAVVDSGDDYGPDWVTLDRDGRGSTYVGDATHIARWDPARVLAECEAKRAVVMWCSQPALILTNPLGDPTNPANYTPGSPFHHGDAPVLRFLATACADHPDYRQEWKP